MLTDSNSLTYLQEIENLFQAYLEIYPADASRLHVLGEQLSKRDPALNDRKNMVGHLTASALVMNDKDEFLLIYHRFLKRWLQPGGHLDAGESPSQGALRELKEETNVGNVIQVCSLHRENGSLNCPIDIDSHAIPASPAKQEGEHLHHDFQYIFKTAERDNLLLDAGEVSDYKWVSLEELAGGEYGQRLARVAGKIQAQWPPL